MCKNQLHEASEFLAWFYDDSELTPFDYDAEEVYYKYIEECEDEEFEKVLTLKDFEEAIEQEIWIVQNTCDRCSGRGCNWCLMVGY